MITSAYNDRLFSGGWRTRFHQARFHWVVAQIQQRVPNCQSILELGCFDGKLLDFLPEPPRRYVGFDANWEGGLDIARARWQSKQNFRFHKAEIPADVALRCDERFDVAVSMETLEHIPSHLVDGYLERIASHLDGWLFVTVPNEKGVVFLFKWLLKKLWTRDADPYSPWELMNATLGRMSRVERREHKGFDYVAMIEDIARRFDIVAISGHPLGFLPVSLCFGVGIVARARSCRGSAV